MTLSTRGEVDERELPRGQTLLADLRRDLIRFAARRGHERGASMWPSAKYQKDPVAFARDVLGVTLWARQIEILEAVRDHNRVAVRSGHKVGKSFTIAVLAFWFLCSFERARVVLTSTTSRQVDRILWTEIRIMWAKARVPIGGKMNAKAASGLQTDDYREIVGFTARQAEAVAGVSGANLLYLPDEASGIDDHIFEAIEGNMMGGARIAMFSNPTRGEGEFFEAFEGSKKKFFHPITVSALETPNYVENTDTYPGLATRSEVETKRAIYGEESAYWKIRVLGVHVMNEDARVLSVHEITKSEERWEETEYVGRLCIGVDPAGPSGAGDESAFAKRRGLKIAPVRARRGLSEEAHLIEVLGIINEDKLVGDREKPLVILDRDGAVGAKVWGVFLAYMIQNEKAPAFDLIGVRSSERARRAPNEYLLVRDEMWWLFADWVKKGGALPTDALVEKDLHAAKWEHDLHNRARVTDKKEMRKILGRSPDRGDACVLTTFTPTDFETQAQETVKEQTRVTREADDARIPSMDPWSAGDAWDSRRRR